MAKKKQNKAKLIRRRKELLFAHQTGNNINKGLN